jgi:FkbM family methyltransferase
VDSTNLFVDIFRTGDFMGILSRAKRNLRRIKSSLGFILNHPLTQQNRVQAIKRYLFFHLIYPLLDGPVLYPFVENVRFSVRPGMAGIAGNVYTGLEDFEEMSFLLHFLQEGDLFVDVGANVGAYTLLASGVCRAQTIAIEPIPSTYENLLLNLRINDLMERVCAFNIGVSSCKGRLTFSNKLDVLNCVVLDKGAIPEKDLIVVDVTSLDSLLTGRYPMLLKVDVEGWEYEVIEGANQTLTKKTLNAIIVEMHGHENRYGTTYEQVHNLLKGSGFLPCSYDPIRRSLNRLDDFNHHKFNTLYIRNLAEAQKRISNGRRIRVLGQEF